MPAHVTLAGMPQSLDPHPQQVQTADHLDAPPQRRVAGYHRRHTHHRTKGVDADADPVPQSCEDPLSPPSGNGVLYHHRKARPREQRQQQLVC